MEGCLNHVAKAVTEPWETVMTNVRKVDVAIVGAGSAGLYALPYIKRSGCSFVLIDPGPLGTTCARVGCMPSKALIQIAHDHHRAQWLAGRSLAEAAPSPISIPAALAHVRKVRNKLIAGLKRRAIVPLAERYIPEAAEFLEPGVLRAGDTRVEAKRVIIATGSKPFIPAIWEHLAPHLLTTDELFEQQDLPSRMAVIGLGPIGTELGQALARLGIEIEGFDLLSQIAGIADPVVAAAAGALVGRDFRLNLGTEARVTDIGGEVEISAGDHKVTVDKILVSIGRRPNIANLRLKNAGVELGPHGVPDIDPQTMQVPGHPIFFAGDVTDDRQLLHEAGDEGRIAGFNACQSSATRFQRRLNLQITFTEPNICQVGAPLDTLEEADIVIGESDFATLGRAIVRGESDGLLRLYARRSDGKLLGASMAVPSGESLAQFLALALMRKLTLADLIQMPFYHPTMEEGLQRAVVDAFSQMRGVKGSIPELLSR